MTIEALFGPYAVHHRLGAGGMGDVYLACHRELDRMVALKLLRTTGAGRDEAVARLRREARVASQLSHPGLVKVFDFGDVEGVHYLAMELVAGTTLHEVIQQHGPLATEQSLRIAEELLAALGACHDAGLVHRDVKPRNVMLDERGRVRLLDLGLVKPFGHTRYTAAGAVVGTPAYVPPEVFLSPETDADARGDIYQVGVTLYECLAGRPPFDAGELTDLIARICSEPPPALPLAGPDAGRARMFLDRALAKEPDGRFDSCADALAALRSEPAVRPARTCALESRREDAAAARRATQVSPGSPVRSGRARAGAAALTIAMFAATGVLGLRRPAPVSPPETVAPTVPRATTAAVAATPRSPDRSLEDAAATARREAAKIAADGGPTNLGVGRMIATWARLAREVGPALRAAAAGAPGAAGGVTRLGAALTRAFDAWQACDSMLEQYLDAHTKDPLEAQAGHAAFTMATAEATARACEPADAARDPALAPELQAGLACVLALTRPSLSGAARARLDARVNGLARRALAEMMSALHQRPIDPALVRSPLRAVAMIGAKAPLVELVTGARGILEMRRPLGPRLVLVEFELRAAEVDARTMRTGRLAAWSGLLEWFIAAWPHDPRCDSGLEDAGGPSAELNAIARQVVDLCRNEIRSAARTTGATPPPEPDRRPPCRR